ncbi:hypothetical protein cypCar_00036530 [Cyprinus carpio]|nr:hypothetical protein cypCar_00036530 [Cyprinus carpio]
MLLLRLKLSLQCLFQESVIVGSVGSNDWRGALYEVMGSGSKFRQTEITDPAVNKDSYMGYSTVLGMRHGVSLLFSGAPRAEHTGLVTLFTKNESTWTVMRNINGEQIGSYFGASLSLLDVDSDGDSDFLLVGAPLFYQSQPRAEGRLYVYTLSEQYSQKTLQSTTGRFATSLASLKDLNGDGLSDVAVGAPLENEGVVYIYLGDGTHGINPEHAPQLSFNPMEISLNYFECPGSNAFNAFNLTSCFTVTERTSSTGSLEKKLNVSLNLNLDVVRGMSRGFFDPMDSSSRTLQQSVLLDSGSSCSNFSIFMLRCVADTVSPLKIRMNFSQTQMLSGNSLAVLDIQSRTEEYVEVLFQRNCNSNSCVADLKLNFSFTNDTLVVENQAHFTVLVSLANPGDDSYNTSIVLHYPEGLSLSKFDAIKTQFLGTFRVTKWDYDWSDRMEMTITANSDNNGNMSDMSVVNLGLKGLPVSVTLSLPCQTTHVTLTPHNFSMQENSEVCKPEPRDGHCGFVCHQFPLEKFSEVQFNLMAEAVLQNVKEYESYNPHRSQTEVKVEFVIPPSRMLIVCTGAVGGFFFLIIILILLLKCGFFKRNRPDEFFPEDENVTVVEDSPLVNMNAKENQISESNSTEKEKGSREMSTSREPPKTEE